MADVKLHGVNLGGWLILEKWMTPSVFHGTLARDEYELAQTVDGIRRITQHRAEFIKETDFQWLRDHGVNAVRIPVGYWILEDSEPYVSAVRELDWAMDMAKRYDLQVIIDLHGLKGSQNGQDHSGHIGASDWYKNSTYRHETLVTLQALATRYRDCQNFWGLQIINEPKSGLFQFTLRRFYKEAYTLLDSILAPHTRIIFSDAWTPRLLSGIFGQHNERVVMDIHLYHMATPLSQFFSVGWFMKKTIRRSRLLRRLSTQQPIIIGEWSGMFRQRVFDQLPRTEHTTLVREYTRLQLEAYQDVAGWFYWSYKTETPGAWSFKSQVENSTISHLEL